MTYNKPELIQMGSATDAIQSILSKDETPFDHSQGQPALTSSSAYVADE
jgi:hypothetical protein